MTNQINTSDGASIDGNVNAAGDFVGRDKTINNLIIVGRFLELAQVESLLPKIEDREKFSSITEAIEGALNSRLNCDLAEAVAFAGEVIGDFFLDNKDIKGYPVPLIEILDSLVNVVGDRLVEMDYWDAHSELAPGYSVLRLYSTEEIFKKYFSKSVKFALLGNPEFVYGLFDFELGVDGESLNRPQLKKRFTHKQIRVIIVGIVLDLIRIKSEDKDSYQLLQDMADWFNRHK